MSAARAWLIFSVADTMGAETPAGGGRFQLVRLPSRNHWRSERPKAPQGVDDSFRLHDSEIV
jgi:hypothetical protein